MAYIAFGGGNNADQGKNTEHMENLLRSSNAQNKVRLLLDEFIDLVFQRNGFKQMRLVVCTS